MLVGLFVGASLRWFNSSADLKTDLVFSIQTRESPSIGVGEDFRSIKINVRPPLDKVLDRPFGERSPLLVRYLNEATGDELAELLAWYADRHRSGEYGHLGFLFVRWLEIDPHGALEAARSLADWNVISQCLQVWIEKDPESAIASLTSEERRQYLPQLVCNLVGYDQREAARLFLNEVTDRSGIADEKLLAAIVTYFPQRLPELAKGAEREDFSLFAREWAKLDPDAALEWAMGIKRYNERNKALAIIYETTYADDRAGLMEVYRELPNGHLRMRLTPVLAKHWVSEDQDEALAWANGLRRRCDRQAAWTSIAREVVEEDVAAGFAWLAEKPNLFSKLGTYEARSEIVSAALKANEDTPFRALEWLSKAGAHSSTVNPFLDRWLDRAGPATVIEQLKRLSPGLVRNVVMEYAISQWTLQNLEAAKAFVSEVALTEGFEDSTLAKAIYEQFPVEERERLIPWVQTLSNDGQKDFFTSSAGVIAANQPQAIEAFMELVPEGVIQQEALRSAVSRIEEAERSLRLLERLPPQEREDLYPGIAYRYTYQDPQEASKWLSTLPIGAAKDAAIVQMIRALTYGYRNGNIRDPEGAFYWAQQIDDEAQQAKQLSLAVGFWRRQDPQAARAALEASEIEAAVKTNLLEKFKP